MVVDTSISAHGKKPRPCLERCLLRCVTGTLGRLLVVADAFVKTRPRAICSIFVLHLKLERKRIEDDFVPAEKLNKHKSITFSDSPRENPSEK